MEVGSNRKEALHPLGHRVADLAAPPAESEAHLELEAVAS